MEQATLKGIEMAEKEKDNKKEKDKKKEDYGPYQFDELVSAWIKEMRMGNVENAFYWLNVMLEGGVNRWYVARRLAIFAVEDAFDPQAIILGASIFNGIAGKGFDDNALWQGTYWMCKAPKFWESEEGRKEYEVTCWKVIDELSKAKKKKDGYRDVPSYALDYHTKRGGQMKHEGQSIDTRYSGTRWGRKFMCEQHKKLGKLDPEVGKRGSSYNPTIEMVNGVKEEFKVESESLPGTFYHVNLKESTCTCPHFQNRGVECKHIRFAMNKWLPF